MLMRGNTAYWRHIFLVAAMGSLAACDSGSRSDFRSDGERLLAESKYEAAIVQLRNAAQASPQDAETRVLLGTAFHAVGDPTAAEIEFRKAIDGGVAKDRVFPKLLELWVENGDFKKVLDGTADAKLESPAARAEVLARRGDALLATAKVDAASAAMDEALGIDSKNATARLGRARLLAVRGDNQKALEAVQTIVAEDPRHASAQSFAGDLFRRLGKPVEATKAYDAAIAARPGDGEVYAKLVPLLIDQRDFAGATARIASLRRVQPSNAIATYLDALLAYSQGDKPRALDAVRQVVRAGVKDPRALLLAGSLESDIGNAALAEQHLSQLVSEYPEADEPRRILSMIYLRTGRLAKARDMIGPMVADPKKASRRSLIAAGEVASAMQQPDRALELFRLAAAQDPGDANLRTRLGNVQLAKGNLDQALSDFRAASEADPTAIAPEVAIVNFYMKQKRLDAAAATARDLVKKHPKEAAAHNVLGLVMMATKDPKAARQAFEAGLAENRDYFPLVSNLTVLDLQEGAADSAKERLKGVFERTKSEDSAILLVGVLERTGATAKEVLDFLERATTARPTSAQLWVNRVDAFAKRGMSPQALEVAIQAEATNPGDATILEALARTQARTGDRVQALGNYGKLATMVPNSPVPYLGQVGVHAAAKDWPRAMSAAQKAVDVAPDAIAGYIWLTKAASRAGRMDLAYSTAQAMQKRWPSDPESYLSEARLLIKDKREADVEQVLRRGIAATQGVTLVMQLVQYLETHQRGKEVDGVAMDWIRKHPHDPSLAIELGDKALKNKEFPVASQWYKQALDQQPDNVLAMNNRAWVLGQMRSPEAIPVARKALALAPENAQVLDTLGGLLLDAGQHAEAASFLGKAVERSPDATYTRLNLVKAMVASGRAKEVQPHLEILQKLQLSPDAKAELAKLAASASSIAR